MPPGPAPRCLMKTSVSSSALAAHVLGEQRAGGAAQVPLAVGRVLEQLAVLRQVALRRRDVGVGLDAVGPQRVLGGALRDPPVRRRPRDDDVVALGDVEGAEHGLHACPPTLDVHALVAHPVAVPGTRGAGDGIRDAHVPVAEHQATARDDVGVLHVLGLEQVVQPQVPRDQRVVGRRGEVPDGPLPRTDHGRGDVAVVEQGGVGGEPLLTHQLLVVELTGSAAAGRSPVLRVPLGRDAAHGLVVRHCPPRRGLVAGPERTAGRVLGPLPP